LILNMYISIGMGNYLLLGIICSLYKTKKDFAHPFSRLNRKQ